MAGGGDKTSSARLSSPGEMGKRSRVGIEPTHDMLLFLEMKNAFTESGKSASRDSIKSKVLGKGGMGVWGREGKPFSRKVFPPFPQFSTLGATTMLDRQQTGIVFNVQKFSVHDGEGIRTLVFLKGCPLHCPWCSNPESQRREPERAYNPTRCLTAAVCGRCAKACPTGAVSIVGGLVYFDRSKCTGCNACVRACPSGAQTVYGETQSVDQILSRVEEDGVFYTRSGGGLTLSGGEALAQPDFALALLREARKRHIHTTIETCGHYPTDVLDQACRVLDALIFDIKCLDSARHKKATGVGSELILKNIGHVFEHFPELPVLIRTPVIPGFNDTEEDILGIREMIPRKANIRYEALTYHRMGQPKYGYLGRRYELEGVKADEAFMKRLNIMLKTYE